MDLFDWLFVGIYAYMMLVLGIGAYLRGDRNGK